MTGTILKRLEGVLIPTAIIFAAGFAYQSNATLAVINAKLDRGLMELKECRAVVDSHSISLALLEQRVGRKGQ